MESFYTTHKYLVERTHSPVRRLLMDEIDWSQRLIGIKGSRGVGKTTFLLQYAKEHYGFDRQCLYVNFNNFYFTEHSLLEFAEQFYNNGGRVLLIDQTFKYENWSKELRACHDRFKDLKIVFSASTVMRLIEDNQDIKDVVVAYNLRGFSLREYINLKTGLNLPPLSLEDIINNHTQLALEITKQTNPLDCFEAYLHHGFYPFFLEQRNFTENLIKTMNMMLEVDILIIKQIEPKYLSKIRKLLYLILRTAPDVPNVSQLSKAIETSRATVMNYIKCLRDARLLNTLYAVGDEYPKKPKQIFVHNTNLMNAINAEFVNRVAESRTFFYNALLARHTVNICKYQTDFCIDKHYFFRIDNTTTNRTNNKVFFVESDTLIGNERNIPLWIFGFLY